MRTLFRTTRFRGRAALLALAAVAVLLAVPALASAQTVVTIQFDDGTDDQLQSAALLEAHGMKGTYFINSGRLGLPGYMTLSQVHGLADAGHEIGGHTVSHADLPTLDVDEQKRQVCNDRVALLNDGFDVKVFAYPYGSFNASTKPVISGCGYNAARTIGGIVTPTSCSDCAFSETIPSSDQWAIRTPDSIKTTTTLAQMEGFVLQAEQHGGGWVNLVIHHVCNNCTEVYGTSPAQLNAFLDWLQPRAASGTVVRTMGQVVGGATQPPVAGPPPPPPGSGSNVLPNPSLETDANNDLVPDCWQFGGFGNNTATFTRTADAHEGSFGQQVDMTSFTDGDRKLIIRQDLGSCASSVTVGRTYTVSGWYKSNGNLRLAAYARNSAGGWAFFAQQPAALPAASTWTKTSFTTPAIPAGTTGLSIGFSMRSTGTFVMDDFSLADTDQTAPTVTLTAPSEGQTLTGTTTLTANANDASGILRVEFLVNGAVVGTDTDAPYSFDWDSTTITSGNASVTARAVDAAQNTTTAPSALVTVSNIENDVSTPVTTATCDGAACAGWHAAGTSLALTATDTGSGVDRIRYTTDGSVPTLDNGSTYSSPLTINATTPVQFRAYDIAGNVEPTQTLNVQIDTDDPTASATCNNASCAGPFFGPVSVALAGADASSGVASIRYTTDGSAPTPSHGTVYSGPFGVASTTTVRFLAIDGVGNAGAAASQTITIGSPTVKTVVSIQFDDGSSEQYGIRTMLAAHGMNGTFYINSAEVGTSGFYMSWAQIHDLADDGNEIGGHTLHHPHLPALTAQQQTTEICDDHANLVTQGFNPTSFAYPYGEWNAASKAALQSCGYNVARTTSGIESGVAPYAESIPPADALATRTPQNATSTMTLADLQAQVTQAEAHGGGWVQLVFHRMCANACDEYSTSPALFNQLLDWLAPRAAQGTVVRTVGEVASGAVAPADTTPPTVALTAPTANATVAGTVNLTANASDAGGVNRVEFLVGATVVATDTSAPYAATWDSTTVANGPVTITARAVDAAGNASTSPVNVTVANPVPDVTPPTVALTAPADGTNVSGTINLTATATDAGGVNRVEFLIGTTVVGTDTTAPYQVSWNSSSTPNGSATVTARAIDGAGNAATATATVTVANVAADTTPPTVALTAPAAGTPVGGTVALAATAADAGGIARVEFLVGTTIVATDATAPYEGTWNSASTPNGAATITARAVDAAGNTATAANAVIVDHTNPTVSITAPASLAVVSGTAVNVTANAADANGVARVELLIGTTVLGSDTTAPYAIPWNSTTSANGAVTLTVRAVDRAGNTASAQRSVITNNDKTLPTVSLTAPAANATVSGTINVTANASDAGGINRVEFLVGTTVIATDTTSPYSASWNTTTTANGAATVTARAVDQAGNAATAARNVTVSNINDTVAPVTTITCNGAACPTGTATASQLVALAATDTGGSGLNNIRYTTNGTDPTATTGTVYSAAFRVWETTTVKYRAFDKAGNAEAVKTTVLTLNLPNLLQNAGLETDANNNGVPDCWTTASSGLNAGSVTRTNSQPHGGTFAETLAITLLLSGNRQLYSTRDTGTCAPAATAGRVYRVRVWYRGTGPTINAFYRNASGSWAQAGVSARLANTTAWTLATWDTPALPSGANRISAGITLPASGSVTVDDISVQ